MQPALTPPVLELFVPPLELAPALGTRAPKRPAE
jgi:hypothetical protein